MKEIPSEAWLKQYENYKIALKSPVDLHNYFTAKEIANAKLQTFSIGKVSLPTGEIVVFDPSDAELERKPYFLSVAPGEYDITVCAATPVNDSARYAAVMVTFRDKRPITFIEALIGNENLKELGPDEYFGFNVETGLAVITDAKVKEEFARFSTEWKLANPGKDLYDHYFADFFENSYKNYPELQREGGEWINWSVPGTEYHIPIFQTGYGEGIYPVYFGLDEFDNICTLVINMIDLEMDYHTASNK